MASFDTHKIRDTEFRRKFLSKLGEIQAVREKNTFLDYASNKGLFQELEAIYEENLKAYRKNYQANLRKFDRVRTVIEANKNDMHPLRYRRVTRLYSEIEETLDAEDYAQNAQAKKLIRQLEEHAQKAVEEYLGWKKDMETYRHRLRDIMTQVWAEDYTTFKNQYQEIKKLISGDRLPPLPIKIEEEAVAKAVDARKLAFKELKDKTKKSPRFQNRIMQIRHQYYSREDFEKLKAEIESGIKRRFWKRAAVLTGGLVILGLVGWYTPQVYRYLSQESAWKEAQTTNTIESYESYLEEYPRGKYIVRAHEGILAVPKGKLSDREDMQGNPFDYDGDLLDAKPHGKGVARYKNGAFYDGFWKNGLRDSIGTFIDIDSSVYTGEWKNDLREGHGKLTLPNGNEYTGGWKKNRYSGYGTLDFLGGARYEGEWKDGVQNGEGTFTDASGAVYLGQWKGGLRHGTGTLEESAGITYSGNWSNGLREGKGTQTWTDGRKYEGEWKADKRHGRGLLTWPNESHFTGSWVNDTISGEGTFVNRYRDITEGRWKGTVDNVTLYQNNLVRTGRFEGGLFMWDE